MERPYCSACCVFPLYGLPASEAFLSGSGILHGFTQEVLHLRICVAEIPVALLMLNDRLNPSVGCQYNTVF